jgi:hypothetical protein
MRRPAGYGIAAPAARAAAALALAAASLLGLAAPPAAAQSRCIEAKLKAAGGYFRTLAGCESKSYAKGGDVDPLCVARAQAKLQKGFTKAAGKGDCPNPDELEQAADVVDDALPALLEILDPPPPVCCASGFGFCVLAVDEDACNIELGGTAGPPGTVCDGQSGSCVPAGTESYGPCCTDIPIPPTVAAECVVGPSLEMMCTSAEGTLSEGSCHPARRCVAPGDEARSRCTSAKAKASGRYALARARCQAKAQRKGEPVDIVCLGKAQSKLQAAFPKAERRDDCETLGEHDDVRNKADGFLDLLFSILEAPPALCCQTALACFWAPDLTTCEAIGAPGAPGSACSGTGECTPPPAADGNCCESFDGGGLTDICVSSTLGEPACTASGAVFVPDAVCLPAQVCID